MDVSQNGLFQSCTHLQKNKSISLARAAAITGLQEILHLPISVEAFSQLETLLANICDGTAKLKI